MESAERESPHSESSSADRVHIVRAIPNIPLIDKRPQLPSVEKKRLNSITERVFQQIQNAEKISFDPDVNEVSIAKTMDEQKKRISERKKTLARDHRQNAPALNDIFNADQEIQEAQRQFKELKKQKNVFLRNGMAEYLTGNDGQMLQTTIREIIFAIHEEIFRRGDDVYTENALITLIYELVYDAFLWRGRKRKDGVTPIFFSHLKEAVLEHIAHGFFTMPRIVSALKHDDIEDLPLHRDGPKWDWLYCSDLYIHHFNTERSPRYPKSPEVYLSEVMANTRTTIMAATNPFIEDPSTESLNNHHEKDEQKLIRFYENLLQHGYLGVLKILEQIQNAQTILALGAKRAPEKLNLMLRHYAMLAKILELKKAYRDLVGAGIDFYRPELRTAYAEKQKKQMLRHLGLDRSDTGKTLPESLLKKKPSKNTEEKPFEDINKRVRQFLDDPPECAESEKIKAVQQKIRQEIQAVFAPIHTRIISMEIVPTPLEDYVDIVRLIKDRDYILEIPEEDPLFEVVILVKSQDDMQKVIREIAEKVPHTIRLEELPSVNMPNYPQKGTMLNLKDPHFGGEVRIRINTVYHEVLAQRGVYTNHNMPLPEPLRSQLRQALKDARLYQLPIIETVEERVLRGNMVIFTDAEKRQGFCLPEGACVLDLAATLPERLGVQTFLHAKSATNTTNVIAPLQHQGSYRIETAEQNTTLDLGHLPFCVSARYHRVLKKYFKTRPPEKRKQESLTRAKEYIQKLNDLFGIDDPEIILRLSMDIAKEQPENLLHRIGEGNVDPLRVLSRYVNRSCHAKTEFILKDQPGVLETITKEIRTCGINIDLINQKPMDGNEKTAFITITCDFPPWLPPYEILKLFLRFTYMPTVQEVRVDGNKSGLFKFPPHIQYPPGAEFDSDTLA